MDDTLYDTAALEAGNRLFSQSCRFMLSVADLHQLPAADRYEVAFAGRSNVGKSSLINALCGAKGLAKTSSTPGRTQQLNYFNLADKLYLVDLPGYGFAKAPTAEVKKWQYLLVSYLKGRPNLRRVFLRVDSRHGLKKNDTDIMTMLDQAAVTYQIILTKADKISGKEVKRNIDEIRETLKFHAAGHIDVLATSSEKNQGIDFVRAEIARLA